MSSIPRLLAAVLLCMVQQAMAVSVDVTLNLLGVDEASLKIATPGIHRLTKPVAGPRGLKGIWQTEDVDFASLPLETTFFVRSNKVERIEQEAMTFSKDCSAARLYATALDELAKRLGSGIVGMAELPDTGTYKSIAWSTGAVDIQAHIWQSAAKCRMLMVFVPHTKKMPPICRFLYRSTQC